MITSINLNAARRYFEWIYAAPLPKGEVIEPRFFPFASKADLNGWVNNTNQAALGYLHVCLIPTVIGSNQIDIQLTTLGSLTSLQIYEKDLIHPVNYNVPILEFTDMNQITKSDIDILCCFAGWVFTLDV